MKVRAKYLKLTDEKNALDFLEKAYFFISKTETDVFAWKWVVLCLHSALYGFLIAALKGTDWQNVVYKTKKYYKLISFNEALKRCQDPNEMRKTVFSQHLHLNQEEKDAIKLLKETLRNNFEHYIPKGWFIELHGLPNMCLQVLSVISFLALETRNYQNLNTTMRRKIKSYIFQSKKIIKASQLYKETLNF